MQRPRVVADTSQVVRKFRSERGASLLESAIVFPIFALLLFAILEFGLGFNSLLSTYDTSRTSARVASAMANEPDSDYVVVRAAVKAAGTSVRGDLRRIVVFRAAGPEATVPDACRTAAVGVADTCNVYLPADFDAPVEDFGCDLGERDIFWCPSDRKVALTGTNGPPDYIGVWVQVEHGMLTGFFGGARQLTDQTVMRIEPRRR